MDNETRIINTTIADMATASKDFKVGALADPCSKHGQTPALQLQMSDCH